MHGEPEVRLIAACPRPLDTAVAAARTCYSAAGPLEPAAVGPGPGDGSGLDSGREKRDRLAAALYTAGHHTTYQHAHFVFVLERVSRQFVWSFLHAHPFANSEQVSQRYVAVEPAAVHVPDLGVASRQAYLATVDEQHRAYRRLVELLSPVAEAELLKRFPSWTRHPATLIRQTRRKAQEVARAVLPVGTHTALYHTISCLTLFRYRRLCRQYDVPEETSRVVERMVALVLELDPGLATVLQEPLQLEETPEHALFMEFHGGGTFGGAFRDEFDRSLGGSTSRLIGRGTGNVACVAAAVRAVLGLERGRLADGDAVRLALDPGANRLLGEDLNLTTLSKLGRCLHHAHYTFAKKLSHAADSQDQRHRMVPAARPLLAAVVGEEPDVVVPGLVSHAGGEAEALFRAAVARAWDGAAGVLRGGGSREKALYLLPNALALRFVESADLLDLHHKHRLRLCYNAQEEIWRASLEEARQISTVEPAIGRWLLPPCGVRHAAGRTPFCSEGEHYCGVPVWRMNRDDYDRVI